MDSRVPNRSAVCTPGRIDAHIHAHQAANHSGPASPFGKSETRIVRVIVRAARAIHLNNITPLHLANGAIITMTSVGTLHARESQPSNTARRPPTLEHETVLLGMLEQQPNLFRWSCTPHHTESSFCAAFLSQTSIYASRTSNYATLRLYCCIGCYLLRLPILGLSRPGNRLLCRRKGYHGLQYRSDAVLSCIELC